MKLKFILIAGFSVACTLFLSAQLSALGLGVYGTGSKSSTTWTYHKNEVPDFHIKSSDSKMGAGFVLDTNLAKDNLFNYRLNIGFAKITLDNEKTSYSSFYGIKDITGYEYHLYNTFGFGIVRTEEIRLWIGPQIGFGVIRGEYDLSSGQDNDFTTIFFSGALAAGMNVNIGDIVTFGFDAGYRLKQHWGGASVGNPSFGITGKERELYANVSFILRINDFFPTY